MPRPPARARLAAAALLAVAAAGAHAQAYPSKPVRLVIGFPAGGAADILARIVGPRVAEQLGQQVVIDNRGGANGNIGAELVARAAPDGYTLMMVVSSFATNHHLYSKLPFDPLRDFAPVSLLTSSPLIIVSHPSLPVKSVKDLIAVARSRPGEINCGVAGSGSGGHLTMELLKSMARIDILVVPHKGGGAAISDTLGGQLHLTLNNSLALMPHIKAGKLRALGVTSLQRLAVAPEIPTLAESGLPGFDSALWYGIVLPAKAPPAVVARLHGEFARVMQQPDLRERLTAEGVQVIGSTPEQFAEHLRRESDKWGKVIREARIRLD
jgi:tripartite-type tricarboxylate transporter receptor subunit TctC